MKAAVVGRDRELGLVVELLDPGPGTRGLLLQGEAGAGKTTVWRHAVSEARARGFTLLVSRPLELDFQIPFAGLHDLLGGVIAEVLPALPDPQRRALETALLLADPVGPPPEASAIAF